MPWQDICCCISAPADDVLELDFGHQLLTDVPSQVFVSERTLQVLHLEANRIVELPRALFHCHELTFLDISDNQLKTMPPAIASLINLQHLNLSRNGLRDIPDNIKCCKQLTYLNVSVNPLEKLPDGFTQLIALEELFLSDTFLDFLPANFGRLSKLRVLDLSDNSLNTLPRSMGRLTMLQELDIGRNEFSDLPEVIGLLPELRDLLVDSNKIRFIPAFFGNLHHLQSLDISNNNLQWVAPEIEDCVGLTYLVLSSNSIEALPEEIGNLKELTFLKLDENNLSSLPASIGKLTNLEELVISDNTIPELPPTIGLLRKLQILLADDNRLTQLPSELCSCASLHILSVRNNLIENLPSEMGHLSAVRVVNICDNRLRNLPVSVLDLHHLSALWLSPNQSTPLTTLQQEMDPATGKMVLVSIMFPQLSRPVSSSSDGENEEEPLRAKTQRPHIRFAESADLRRPSPLTRAPTPYPKELRSMAKHARILLTRPLPAAPSPVPASPAPLLAVTVKTATVIKPTATIEPASPGNKPTANVKPMSPAQESPLAAQHDLNATYTIAGTEEELNPESEDFPLLSESVDAVSFDRPLQSSSPMETKYNGLHFIHSPDLSPIMETSIVNLNTTQMHRSRLDFNATIDKVNFENMGEVSPVMYPDSPDEITEEEPVLKKPPPYHIAAAYSKQAAFFRDSASSPLILPSDSVMIPVTDLVQNENDVFEHEDEATQFVIEDPSPCPVDEDQEDIVNYVDSKEPVHKTESPVCRIPKLTSNEVSGLNPRVVRSLESKIPSFTKRDMKPVTVSKPRGPSRMLQPGFHAASPVKSEPVTPPPEHKVDAAELGESVEGEPLSPSSSFKSRIPSRVPLGKVAPSTSLIPTSPTWVFGQHKNPTVCPVMIVKNPGLGFSIGGGATGHAKTEVADSTGIFVTKVQPGGPASDSLKPGDKILQVDGVDFAKINHDQAVEVLKQTKNVVHMMISRLNSSVKATGV